MAGRRAAAFQAYYENLPLRASALPDGPDMQLYRRLAYGDLLDINVLDTRQYRDDQAAGGGLAAPNPGSLDPNRTMMGREQEQWLLDNFERSRVRWQVLANQAPMAETDMDDTEAVSVFMDPWDGYDANRRRMLDGARDRGVDNLVVLTGDRHRHHASDIKADYRDPAAPVLASEFVCTSVTAEGKRSRHGLLLGAVGTRQPAHQVRQLPAGIPAVHGDRGPVEHRFPGAPVRRPARRSGVHPGHVRRRERPPRRPTRQ
ncbi:alkaline phosphatase D family protein [Nonomuraea glycinis]|uniref:PhoD-like phosphatase metallophosphatase domain-containing protein n=1 Tax=Nonomuraea glycinis TaxID=2047744 RepID=A0A918A469_9ACTN|nr:alkaline phosphatase D family protein [Nonomuraea glycinis]MCA2180421.1 alkaline phosphatase D family protein [Nonomuraea glycinis]GGP04163.1 hypothetical protein GCM10012278_18520 [Nonomuraea glycinis]